MKEVSLFGDLGKEGQVGDRPVALYIFSVKRGPFQKRPVSTADLNTEGKLPVKKDLLITEVKDGTRSSTSSASNDDGRGSSSHVLNAVLFNTSRTVDSDTGWKAINGDPSKTV